MIEKKNLQINRYKALGQEHRLNFIDNLGIYLSNRRIVKEVRKLNPSINCLDIGCSFEARHLFSLLPYIVSGTGIDFCISDSLKQIPKLEFIEGNIEESLDKIQYRNFNLILAISVLEHLWNPLYILEKLRLMLCQNGILLLNVPTWRGKFFLELIAFKLKLSKNAQIEIDDHKMYYDEKDLWTLLIRAGFKPSQIEMNYYKFGLNLFCKITNKYGAEE